METAEGLSVVIPVYNEENAVVETVRGIAALLSEADLPFEIIVVNDGSTDGTGKRLHALVTTAVGAARGGGIPARGARAEEQSNGLFSVVTHPKNRGYGASLKTGIRRARFDTVCITDADATYPNDRIPELYAEFRSGYDMVVGQRSFKKLPTITKPAKYFITSLANFLIGEKIKDLNSGLRVFRRDLAVKYFPIISDGFSFTTTITLAMYTNHYLVKYLPIEYHKREGRSKIRPVRDTLNFVQLIVRTVMYFNPLKIFIPITLSMLSAAVALYVLAKFGLLLDEVPEGTISLLVVASIQLLATGMIADLIDKRIEK